MKTDKLSFDQWMADVDICLVGVCGVTSSDLPDYCYRDSYDNKESPEDAARDALEAAM